MKEAETFLSNHVVLAGAGHGHLQVLRSLQQQPWPHSEVTLVTPSADSLYSGMLPGWMAGHYALDELRLRVGEMATHADVNLVCDRIVRLDPTAQTITLASGRRLAFDVLSLNVGADARSFGFDTNEEHILHAGPSEAFVCGWEAVMLQSEESGRARLAIVGAGAAGVEVALAASYRLEKLLGNKASVAISLMGCERLLPGHSPGVKLRAKKALARRDIQMVSGRATPLAPGLISAGGDPIAVDALILATGRQLPQWLTESGLALAEDGFLAVAPTLQSTSHPSILAAGDIASRLQAPHAKSGVQAVRDGRLLSTNLPRMLKNLPLFAETRRRHTLSLLATGAREAIVSYGRIDAEGAWAWHWKNFIDRQFVAQCRK